MHRVDSVPKLRKEEETLERRRPSRKGRVCEQLASSARAVRELVGQSSAADPAKERLR